MLPAAVSAALAQGTPPHVTASLPLAPEQLSWLRQLAAGATVAQLAERAGYSERAMFRLLQSIYRKMGVRTRIEAIIRAQEQGWLAMEAARTPTAGPG